MFKKLLLLCVCLIVVATSAVFYIKNQVNTYLDQTVDIQKPTLVTVESGSSLGSILRQFEQESWIAPASSDYVLKFLRRLHPEIAKIKAGTFELEPNLSLKEALLSLVHGQEAQLSITFVEGSTFKEWRTQFDEAPHLQHTTVGMSEQEIAKELGIEYEKLEGLFLANTYHYTVGMSDLDIMRRANKSLNQTLEKYWDERQDKLPFKNAYEALILASIIEKETAVAKERPLVSSVFVNRLNIGMRLQTDPTVIYGMGDKYQGNIRKRDLQTPTPYNTYTINGLPPTPIAMVGAEAIAASVNPDESNYFYFVATGNGGHVFSKNLRDHNRAVQAYLRTLRAGK